MNQELFDDFLAIITELWRMEVGQGVGKILNTPDQLPAGEHGYLFIGTSNGFEFDIFAEGPPDAGWDQINAVKMPSGKVYEFVKRGEPLDPFGWYSYAIHGFQSNGWRIVP